MRAASRARAESFGQVLSVSPAPQATIAVAFYCIMLLLWKFTNLIACIKFTLDIAYVTRRTSIMISLSGFCGLIPLDDNKGVNLGLL